jgi:hypothetical protein
MKEDLHYGNILFNMIEDSEQVPAILIGDGTSCMTAVSWKEVPMSGIGFKFNDPDMTSKDFDQMLMFTNSKSMGVVIDLLLTAKEGMEKIETEGGGV